jgi:hypothetical protein
MAHRNEAHIVNAPMTGHLLSTDCWCEPTEIRWITNIFKIKVLIVMHEDIFNPLIPHDLLLDHRDDDPNDWITPLLIGACNHKEPHDAENDE